MKSFLTFLFLCLSSGIFGQTTQRFANIQLTATPTEAVAASVTNFLQLDGTGIGEKVSPTTLWSAVVLTGTVDTTDITGISTFARTYLDDTTAEATRATLGIHAQEFYPEDDGAIPNDGLDDKDAIQTCHNRAEAAGGGVVMLNEGVWEIHPLATGIGLLFNGDKVHLKGRGPGSILRVISTTSSTPFEGIASKGYNTTTSAFGASGLWLENFKIECDAYDFATVANRNAHGLVVAGHAPWTFINNVTFGDVCHHQIEVNRSRNVLVTNCNFIGNAESSRVQLDVAGTAGIISTVPVTLIENVTFRDCKFAGRDLTTQTNTVYHIFQLSHSSVQQNRNITIEGCEFGAPYHTTANVGGAIVLFETAPLLMENLVIRNNRFYGQTQGETFGVYLLSGARNLQGCVIENNYFGAGVDCIGVKHAGGFRLCIAVGENLGTAVPLAVATVSTNYATRRGISIRSNVLEPRFVLGATGLGSGTKHLDGITVGPCIDADVSNNTIIFPVFSSEFTAASSDILTTTTSGTTAGMRPGDPIRVTTSAADLPLGLAINTTYYVREVLSSTTFTLSATDGGAVLDIQDAGTGTHTWTNYTSGFTPGFNVGYGLCEVQNLRFTNNNCLWQHSTAVTNTNCYSAVITASAMETAGVSSWYEISNNNFSEVGAGSVTYGLVEFASAQVAAPVVRGNWIGNNHTGTFTNADVTQGHNFWRGVPTTPATLGAGATTLAVTGRVAIVTGDGGGNTLSTITRVGTRLDDLLTLKFTDGLVTITDTDAATANTVDLSAAFTSSDRDTLTLSWDGTKWIEAFRSVN